jgi:hypothetical protein
MALEVVMEQHSVSVVYADENGTVIHYRKYPNGYEDWLVEIGTDLFLVDIDELRVLRDQFDRILRERDR